MAHWYRKFDPAREVGSENRIDPSTRPIDELRFEVAQRRGSPPDAHSDEANKKDEPARVSAPNREQTSGYGEREDRENPGKALPQSGTRQSHELPGEGTRIGSDERRDSRAMSQNAARISDFEDRPST